MLAGPSMFDCPARMKTLSGFVAAVAQGTAGNVARRNTGMS
jgi:hypothetical protein